MSFNEFLDYMEYNFNSKNIFYQKAMENQLARNARRPPKKRWNETKLNRAVDKMWIELMRNIYVKFKSAIKSNAADPYQSWINYIEKNEALESLDEMIVDLEFD